MKGFNPFNWIGKCKSRGCYLKVAHPRVEEFAECFGNGQIAFTDRDYHVERRGVVLLVEFKKRGEMLTRGQEIALENISRQRKVDPPKSRLANTVYVITGSHLFESGSVHQVRRCLDGSWDDLGEIPIEEVKRQFREWFDWAEKPYRSDDTHPIAHYRKQRGLF